MDDFNKQAIMVSLRKMFRPDGCFSICDLEQCFKVAGIAPPRAEYDALRLLHCVYWHDMPPGMRAATAEQVFALFKYESFTLPDLFAVSGEVEVEETPKGFLRGLLSNR